MIIMKIMINGYHNNYNNNGDMFTERTPASKLFV